MLILGTNSFIRSTLKLKLPAVHKFNFKVLPAESKPPNTLNCTHLSIEQFDVGASYNEMQKKWKENTQCYTCIKHHFN